MDYTDFTAINCSENEREEKTIIRGENLSKKKSNSYSPSTLADG
jgi:hypothetical protein